MSKKLIMIRHGESAGNAGLATTDHRTIPLTDKGKMQAEKLAKVWNDEPDYILMSPFKRAHDTAQPTIERFPNARLKVMDDLREFTYLAPATCVGTTQEDRRARVDAYWAALDPCYVDGEGAESFNDLTERTRRFLDDMRSMPDGCTVFAFSHMMCIASIRMWLERPNLASDLRERMKIFRTYPFISNAEHISFVI